MRRCGGTALIETSTIAVDLTTRDVLLIGHVAFAVVALGPVTLAVSMFPRHALLAFSDPAARGTAELLHRISRTYAQVAVAVPVLGVVLAVETGYLSFVWNQAALVVTGAAAAVLGFGVIPDQRRVLAGADPRPMSGRLHGLAGLFSLSWIVILALMVIKPA
jgi:hypothetical protein